MKKENLLRTEITADGLSAEGGEIRTPKKV